MRTYGLCNQHNCRWGWRYHRISLNWDRRVEECAPGAMRGIPSSRALTCGRTWPRHRRR